MSLSCLDKESYLAGWYDDSSSSGNFPSTPKAHFKQAYFEAIDLITNCVQERFDQPGYWIYRSLETLLIKASKQEELQDNVDAVCVFYHNDFDKELLHSQLQTFEIHFQTVAQEPAAQISIFDLKQYFLLLSPGQASLLSQVRRLLQLILVIPGTNATAERCVVLSAASRTTSGQQWHKSGSIT